MYARPSSPRTGLPRFSARARRNALLLILWSVIGISLIAVRETLLPFFVAIFLAYVIEPLLRRISAWKIGARSVPRSASIAGLYCVIAALAWAFVALFIPRLYTEVGRLVSTTGTTLQRVDPSYVENTALHLNDLLKRLRLPLRVSAGSPAASEDAHRDAQSGEPSAPAQVDPEVLYTIPLGDLARAAATRTVEALQSQTGAIAGQVQSVVGGALNVIFKFFLVLMLTAFLAVDTERIKRYIFTIVPIEDRNRFDDLLSKIDTGLSGVVRGQLTICLVNGFLTLVGLLVFDVKFAFILATIATLFSLIPIFGSIASTVPIVLVALATSGLGSALLILVWILGIHALEANLLNPKIMGDAARIHPFLVVLALIAGEHFHGIAGALFAVPILSIGLTIFTFVHARALTLEVGAATPAPPAARPPRRVPPFPLQRPARLRRAPRS